MTGLILVTIVVLLLVNAPENGAEKHDGERFIASLITLADMGFLAWLIC